MELKKLLLFVIVLRLALLIKGQLDLPPAPPAPPASTSPPSRPQHPSEEPPQQPPPPRGHDFGAPRLPFPYTFPAPFSNSFNSHPHGFPQGQPGAVNQTSHPGFATPELGFGPPPNFGQREPFVPYRNPNYIFPTRGNPGQESAPPNQDPKPADGSQPVTGTEYHQGFSQTQKTPNPGQDQGAAGFQGFHPQFNFEAFRPNFGPFDYGFSPDFAPPQQVSQNIQVDGQQFGNDVGAGRGNGLPTGPVAGFYGPPPNIRHYSIPSLGVQGYQYDSRDTPREKQQGAAPLGKVEAQPGKA